MFGIFTGTIVNTATVILGTALGCCLKGEKMRRVGDRVFQGFGLFTMVLGISGAVALPHPVFMLISLIIGVAIGELADLDEKFERFGNWLKKRFAKGEDSEGFTNGFLSGVLLFCVGSMTFLGALEAGLQNQHTIYFTKSVLDCFGACMFAMATDAIEYGHWFTGHRAEGTTYSAVGIGNKLGVLLGSGLITLLLGASGYDGSLAVQSASAMNMIRFLYLWAPAILAAIMIVIMFLYQLDKKYDMVMSDLAQGKYAPGAKYAPTNSNQQ